MCFLARIDQLRSSAFDVRYQTAKCCSTLILHRGVGVCSQQSLKISRRFGRSLASFTGSDAAMPALTGKRELMRASIVRTDQSLEREANQDWGSSRGVGDEVEVEVNEVASDSSGRLDCGEWVARYRSRSKLGNGSTVC